MNIIHVSTELELLRIFTLTLCKRLGMRDRVQRLRQRREQTFLGCLGLGPWLEISRCHGHYCNIHHRFIHNLLASLRREYCSRRSAAKYHQNMNRTVCKYHPFVKALICVSSSRQPLIPRRDFSLLPEIKTQKREAKLVSGQLLQTPGQKTLHHRRFNKPDIFLWQRRHPEEEYLPSAEGARPDQGHRKRTSLLWGWAGSPPLFGQVAG